MSRRSRKSGGSIFTIRNAIAVAIVLVVVFMLFGAGQAFTMALLHNATNQSVGASTTKGEIGPAPTQTPLNPVTQAQRSIGELPGQVIQKVTARPTATPMVKADPYAYFQSVADDDFTILTVAAKMEPCDPNHPENGGFTVIATRNQGGLDGALNGRTYTLKVWGVVRAGVDMKGFNLSNIELVGDHLVIHVPKGHLEQPTYYQDCTYEKTNNGAFVMLGKIWWNLTDLPDMNEVSLRREAMKKADNAIESAGYNMGLDTLAQQKVFDRIVDVVKAVDGAAHRETLPIIPDYQTNQPPQY
ncbi:DUF4230 domain-containing protein [Patescibacteria group bacterium]|nr:DUF4230 domain-containing protein [Patescibacteria group bacterium]